MRNAVADWLTEKDADRLAYQLIKYPQRDGWSMRDLLRKSHAVPPTAEHQALFHWVTQGKADVNNLPEQVRGFVNAQKHAETADEVVGYVSRYKLPREAVAAIDTKWLSEPKVLEALLPNMPMTAMVRNLGNLSKAGLLTAMSETEKYVLSVLTNVEQIRKSRIHPLQVLAALNTYNRGKGFRGSGTWTPTRAA
jgi:60 kDa SS-A/Ro ribonucleoprotein